MASVSDNQPESIYIHLQPPKQDAQTLVATLKQHCFRGLGSRGTGFRVSGFDLGLGLAGSVVDSKFRSNSGLGSGF